MKRYELGRLSGGLLGAAILLATTAASAEVVWKVADEGPLAPEVVEILGDDTRTLAFGATGDWELRGTTWHPVPLRTSAVVGSERTLFFANGRFGATTQSLSTSLLELFVLRGDAWTRIWSETSFHPVVRSSERLYVVAETFNTCDCARGGAEPQARRLRSVSLTDGSIREEIPLPACTGTLFVLAGRVHLIELPPLCGGPGARGTNALAATPSYPFYRLDEAGWTQLPAWGLPAWALLDSTPNSLWAFYGLEGLGWFGRILTTAGLSDPIPIPRDITMSGVPLKPFEWNGRLLASSLEGRGNIYLLEGNALVRMTPESPVTAGYRAPVVSVAGSRVFTSAEGWDVHVGDGTGWKATALLGGPPGAELYRMGDTKAFAMRGTRLFRRDETGWTSLSPPPGWSVVRLEAVWGDRPVVRASVYESGFGIFVHDEASGQWNDLGVAAASEGQILATGRDLYIGVRPGEMSRLRDGEWTNVAPSPPPDSEVGRIDTIRESGGEVFVTTNCGCGPSTARQEPTYRVEGDRLVPAFTDLDPRMVVRDVVKIEGRTILLVKDGSRQDSFRALLVSPSPEGVESLLTTEDRQRAGLAEETGGGLARDGAALLFDGLRLERGRFLRQRGELVPRTIDPDLRFASGDRYDLPYRADARVPLLRPVARVRKYLAAAVDAAGYGGTRYRSELRIASFSSSAGSVAKVYAGAGTVPVLVVPLGPGAQRRIEDPVPGFVGPLAVEFEGLSDERDAWAAVRVFSPADGGTAGTSILGTDPGSVPAETTLLRPVRAPGSRLHLALAAGRDGSDLPVWAGADYRQVPAVNAAHPIPAGGFLQLDPDPATLFGPLRLETVPPGLSPLNRSRNDLLGYFVRNDATTNDGTVVPFEEPDVLPGRRTRFLPAVVGLTSAHGRYRTELTFGRRERWEQQVSGNTFSVTYRDERGASSFTLAVEQDAVVEVPDAGAWLVANGVPIDPDAFSGTLTFGSDRWEGAANLLVTAVVQARGRNATGDYGVSVPVVNEVRWATESAVVPGLREDADYRSNVALANPEPAGGPDVTLEVILRQASDGAVLGTLPAVTLAPGRRVQLNQPLRQIGYGGDAWAEMRRTGGAGRFVAYGVVNDNVTSDGTLFPMTANR